MENHQVNPEGSVITHNTPIIIVFRVQQEVDEVLGNKSYVSKEDLDQLEYIEQVLMQGVTEDVCTILYGHCQRR